MPPALPPDTLKALVALRDQLRAAPAKGGERGWLVAAFAELHGCKASTVYRWLQGHAGHASGRKRRADAGTTRLPDEVLKFVAGSIQQSITGHGKSTKPICVAMNIAHENGMDVNVSKSRMGALLRANRMDVKTQARARNHQRMRSLHPNHVHQIDLFALIAHYPGALVALPEREACAWFMRGKEETRVVRDNRITFVHPQTRKSELYILADWAADLSSGTKVRVSPLLLGDGLVRVEIDRLGQDAKHVDVAPERAFDAFGRPLSATVLGEEHRSAPHSAAQQAAKQIAEATYGPGTSLEDAEQLKAKNVRPFQHLNGGKGVVAHTHLGKADLPSRLLPEALPLQTADLAAQRSVHAARVLSQFEAAAWLTANGVPPSPERHASVRAWHPEGVPEDQLEALKQRLTVRGGLRVVAGGAGNNP